LVLRDAARFGVLANQASVNKDFEYASTLLKGTTPALLRGVFGANTQTVDQLDPPSDLGETARASLPSAEDPALVRRRFRRALSGHCGGSR